MSEMRHAKVGIVTIQDDANYGNRLQNFALQEALSRLGCSAESIRNDPPPMARSLLASRAMHALVADGPLTFGRRNLALLRNKLTPGAVAAPPRYGSLRREAITDFGRQRVVTSDVDFRARSGPEWAARYDVIVVGSDQVWNHGFRNAHDIDFATFVPPTRRIAYAASFGVHDIPTFLRASYRSWLRQLPSISVRERRGAEIVAELIHREVPVVVDPTLLLERRDWESVATREPWMDEGPYAVQFFLGPATHEQRSWVAEHAAREGVRLVDLLDLDSQEVARVGPTGFVAALGGAEFVATDSFHAGVFSLLQHTPVVVRSRDETDSRLHTLFDLHGIERLETSVPGLTTALAPDWEHADALVQAERRASWEFLESALQRATGETEFDA